MRLFRRLRAVHPLALAYLLSSVSAGEAVEPGTAVETAALAKESAPGVMRAGKGIAEVPWQAGQCLRLPLGLVQIVLSPLPGVGLVEGLKNTGIGAVAPFKLCIAILEMPYEVMAGLGDAAGA